MKWFVSVVRTKCRAKGRDGSTERGVLDMLRNYRIHMDLPGPTQLQRL